MRWFKPEAGSIEIFSPQGIVPSRTTPLTEQRSFHKLDRSAPSSSSSHRRRRGCIRRPHAPQRLAVFPEQRSLIASRHYSCHSPPLPSANPSTTSIPLPPTCLAVVPTSTFPFLYLTLPYPTLYPRGRHLPHRIHSPSLKLTYHQKTSISSAPLLSFDPHTITSLRNNPVTDLPKTATATKTPR